MRSPLKAITVAPIQKAPAVSLFVFDDLFPIFWTAETNPVSASRAKAKTPPSGRIGGTKDKIIQVST